MASISRCIAVGAICLLAGGAARAGDWPQRQGNPQHTGYTTDSPQPPYRVAWKFYFPDHQEKVHPQVQPIVYAGGVFVGTKMGHLYCLNADTGKVRWEWTGGGGPILNTAAGADGRVIFSCLDGMVRALDTQTGKQLWAFDGGINGFNTAPCLADGKVFIGSRAGVFYCLDQKTGQVVWQRDMGAYIFCSAAWDANRVFFGTEDMVFHCLDARTGKPLWHTGRLYGVSFKDFFPMVHDGRVVIRTFSNVDAFPIPVYRSRVQQATAQGTFEAIPASVSDTFVDYLTKHPDNQSLFVFDEKTGQSPYIACHNRGGTNDGVAAVPCVDARGRYFLALTAENPDKYWGGMIFATIDPQTGRFGQFIWRGDTKQVNSDEQENFSVGGHILFCAQQEEGEAGLMAAFDLRSAEQLKIPLTMGWMQGLSYNAQEQGGHAFAISGDRFYHIAFNCLGCWQGGPAAAPQDKEARR